MWQVEVFGMTDVGQERRRNEDHFLVATLSKTLDVSQSSLDIGEETRIFGNSQGRLLLVADGMGGHPAGDRASAIAINAFADYVLNMLRWYFRADPSHDANMAADLRDAVMRCQRSIREEIQDHPEAQGMGSTLTLAYVIWPRMFVVHVGDSRCYVLRNGVLKQLTRDHTVAQLIAEGLEDVIQHAAEDVPESHWQHMLWNAVGGTGAEPQPDIFRVDLEFDDRLLLCTDGLSKHVPDPDLSRRLKQEQPALEICSQLIADANAAGGSDNITAIVAKFPKPRVVGDALSAEADARTRADRAISDTVAEGAPQSAVSG